MAHALRGKRHDRKDGPADGRWKSFGYVAQETADDLQTALEQFAFIAAELKR